MNYKSHYKDKVALITGGGQGLGQSLCLKLADFGATVVCTDKNLKRANETLEFINSKTWNNKAQAIQLDVTNNDQIISVISTIISSSGNIDFLFNNTGISIRPFCWFPFLL